MRRLVRQKKIQIACDRCTLGVMDYDNPHLWGECKCPCHEEKRMTIHELINELRQLRQARAEPGRDDGGIWGRAHNAGWIDCLDHILLLLSKEEEQ